MRVRGTLARATLALLALALLFQPLTAAAQLPPDVQLDRLWLRAERQIGNGEYWLALASLDEILELQSEHELAIPDAFWFSHAAASHEAGLHEQAVASAVRYLESAGREGEHYLAGLELLDAAESAAERLRTERKRAEREVEARRAARQASIDAQAQAAAAVKEEMVKAAAELVRLAPGMELVVIPAGTFRMGCVSGLGCWDNEKPVHQVTIPEAFAVAKHEVTFAQWDACVAGGGCLDARAESRRQRPRGHRPDDEDWGRGDRPVINVSWDDAQSYVRWLSLETGAEYRLLSESEWEYAARAGSSTAYSWGNEIGSGRANCAGCGSQWDSPQTAPMGSFSPNAFGLHDMHGNVREWVEDCWNDSYSGAPSNGGAWTSGDCSERGLRGGSWDDGPRSLRSSNRGTYSSYYRFSYIGFRVARTLTP